MMKINAAVHNYVTNLFCPFSAFRVQGQAAMVAMEVARTGPG